MGMFREPYARTTSNYKHALTTIEGVPTKESEDAYRNRSIGLMTMMISGQQDGACGFAPGWPNYELNFVMEVFIVGGCDTSRVPDLDTALRRLESFKFVGLQEEWATSICLLCASGRPQPAHSSPGAASHA